ncbi:MAG: hypothetical protein IJL70_09160 [Treponema sp.]|nr:hypothetical protein [Treponema sp.]
MKNTIDIKKCAAFGVAGNFTGHLEQAGEASDFEKVKTIEKNAPKALFPTYIPGDDKVTPNFLHEFPFSDKTIIFPKGEEKLQIEPECAVIFDATWENGFIKKLQPVAFGASNDCSIRREGAKKISLKKNWGKCTKGFSEKKIELDSFLETSIMSRYRIASFLIRDGNAYPYGEDSAIRDYSYIWEKLNLWLIDRLNNQKDEGPAEDIHSYLEAAGKPAKLLISIGATRYTEFGMNNFLKDGDKAVVVLYPEDSYTSKEIMQRVKENRLNEPDISALYQTVVC